MPTTDKTLVRSRILPPEHVPRPRSAGPTDRGSICTRCLMPRPTPDHPMAQGDFSKGSAMLRSAPQSSRSMLRSAQCMDASEHTCDPHPEGRTPDLNPPGLRAWAFSSWARGVSAHVPYACSHMQPKFPCPRRDPGSTSRRLSTGPAAGQG